LGAGAPSYGGGGGVGGGGDAGGGTSPTDTGTTPTPATTAASPNYLLLGLFIAGGVGLFMWIGSGDKGAQS
jgi:hypothetical protein